jgi:MFS family permease
MTESLDQASSATITTPTARWCAVTAGAVGNFTEFFDWTIYSYLAPIFASQFFPAHSQAASLLLAFSTFAVGYLMRPIGGIVLGRLGDARGRRDALSLSILLMGLGSLAIGILPGYTTIGLAAPLLMVLMRLLQGFSAGGEGGVSATFLLEFAPPGRRAPAGSWRDFSSAVSTFAALGVSTLVTSLLSTSRTVHRSRVSRAVRGWPRLRWREKRWVAGCLTATMAGQFPTATRGSGVSLAYAVAVGGTFPIVTYFAAQNARMFIFLIVVAAAIVSGFAFYLMPETRTREL